MTELQRKCIDKRRKISNGVKGFQTVNKGNYNDLHGLRTCSHPQLNELREWYATGRKRYVEDLTMTPTIAKMWYVCDGWLAKDEQSTDRPRAAFKVSNESDRPEYLVRLFESAGFHAYHSHKHVMVSAHETLQFLDWMGDPPRGFEYKWDYE